MNDQKTHLVETAVLIFNEGFRLPLEGAGKRVIIYISPIDAVAPLTLPVARRLLFTKTLTALLTGLGYDVQCHSLFADYEQPVKNLTVSIWLRYLELCGENIAYPEDCYQGDYIFDFAATVHRTYSNLWHVSAKDVEELLSQVHSCADIYTQIQEWLGDEALLTIRQIGVQSISRDISSDLQEIDVSFKSWPWANALLRNGTVTEAINRFAAEELLHSDGDSRYIKLLENKKQLMENEAGPTPFAVQLSHFLSVLSKGGADSDLNICIYDIDEEESIKRIHQCVQLLGYPAASLLEKPILLPQLLEMGEIVHTSPLAEDFVSFREVRQTVGLPNVEWLFAVQPSDASVQIDLSQEIADSIVQQCRGMATNALHQHISSDASQWDKVLNSMNPSQQKQAESVLQTINKFHDVVRQALQTLEPALLVNYYRNLCESFFSYYNNHELIALDLNENASSHAKHGKLQREEQWADGDEWIARIMTYSLQRLQRLIDSLVDSRLNH